VPDLFGLNVGFRALVVDLVLLRRVHERLDPDARECFRLFRGIVRLLAWLRRRGYIFVHNALFLPAGTPVKLLDSGRRCFTSDVSNTKTCPRDAYERSVHRASTRETHEVRLREALALSNTQTRRVLHDRKVREGNITRSVSKNLNRAGVSTDPIPWCEGDPIAPGEALADY
jgi:hypothetical protein